MIHSENPDLLSTVLQLLTEQGSSGFAEGIRILVNEAMLRERSSALHAEPYQRCEERLGHANGFKDKTLATRVGRITFKVPQVRGGLAFYPSSLEKGIRSEQALKVALAEMYVQGVSTRKVSAIVEDLCGSSVSSSQVSACAAKLDATLSLWRERPLGQTPYVFLDARYEKVRHGGHFIDCAVLVALGIGADGKRSILGVSVALSEAEVHWRQFLTSLQLRGLTGVELIVSDDHAGLRTARAAVFPSIPVSIVPKPAESCRTEIHAFSVSMRTFSSGISASVSFFFKLAQRAFQARQAYSRSASTIKKPLPHR